MIKKTVSYTDFNGNKIDEVLLFNLTKTELTKMELSENGSMSETIKEAIDSNNSAKILDIFNTLLLNAYGVVSENGKRFIKNETLKQEFEQSIAYDELFMELMSNPTEAENFIKGLLNQ